MLIDSNPRRLCAGIKSISLRVCIFFNLIVHVVDHIKVENKNFLLTSQKMGCVKCLYPLAYSFVCHFITLYSTAPLKNVEQHIHSWYWPFLVIKCCTYKVEKTTTHVLLNYIDCSSDISVSSSCSADLSGLTLSGSGEQVTTFSCLLVEDSVDLSFDLCLLSSCSSTPGQRWVWLRHPPILPKLWKPPADHPASPVEAQSTGELPQPRPTPPLRGQRCSLNLCFLFHQRWTLKWDTAQGIHIHAKYNARDTLLTLLLPLGSIWPHSMFNVGVLWGQFDPRLFFTVPNI